MLLTANYYYLNVEASTSRRLSLKIHIIRTCKADTVAMESTGVYRKPLLDVLIKGDFECYLVNSTTVCNITGSK